jgi:hypothetical protein
VDEERRKSGFAGRKGPKTFSEQQKLHQHILRQVGSPTRPSAAVFVVFTHKPTAGINEKNLPDDTVLVCRENFEQRVPAFSRIAYRLASETLALRGQSSKKVPTAHGKAATKKATTTNVGKKKKTATKASK